MTPRQIPVWVTRQKNLAVVTTRERGKWVVTMCAAAAQAMLGRKMQEDETVKGMLTFVESPEVIDEQAANSTGDNGPAPGA